MSHFAYVTAAYLVSTIVLMGLGGWIFIDQRQQRQALDDLETQGIRRRSRRKAP